jgi:hypothetical protein
MYKHIYAIPEEAKPDTKLGKQLQALLSAQNMLINSSKKFFKAF